MDKWRHLTIGIIDDEKRSKIEDVIMNLELVENVLELAQLLSGVTGHAL